MAFPRSFLVLLILGPVASSCGSQSNGVSACLDVCSIRATQSCETELTELESCQSICDAYTHANTLCQESALTYYACIANGAWHCAEHGAAVVEPALCKQPMENFSGACANGFDSAPGT